MLDLYLGNGAMAAGIADCETKRSLKTLFLLSPEFVEELRVHAEETIAQLLHPAERQAWSGNAPSLRDVRHLVERGILHADILLI